MKILCLALLFVGFANGCCTKEPRVEPVYPNNVSGWKEYEKLGVRMRGSFVLKKEEATDNGKLQIKLLSILPPDPCAETGRLISHARVILQFVSLPEQKKICEVTLAENEGSGLAQGCGVELDKFGITGIGIRAINLNESWVFFELSG